MAPGRFVSIYFDHGSNPSGAAYAAAYFPKATCDQMPDLARDFADTASHARNPAGHAFSYGSYTGLVFFESGSMEGYTADRPCFGALRGQDDARDFALYEPSWEACPLTLGLSFTPAARPMTGNLRLNGSTLTVDVQPGVPITWRLSSPE